MNNTINVVAQGHPDNAMVSKFSEVHLNAATKEESGLSMT
jgi:hypothetical protein